MPPPTGLRKKGTTANRHAPRNDLELRDELVACTADFGNPGDS